MASFALPAALWLSGSVARKRRGQNSDISYRCDKITVDIAEIPLRRAPYL